MSELWSLQLAVLALAVLWLLSWLPRRRVPGSSVALFSCLLPSWRFFDQVETMPVLRYRTALQGDDWSDWQDVLLAPPRTPGSLLSNAAGNLHLACSSLVEHLVADLGDTDALGRAPHELVSYELVCALVERRMHRAALAHTRYQFCLVEAEDAGAPLFVSSVHGA
jgi:hypothetical protein